MEEEEREDLGFLDAGGYNRNRERGIGDLEWVDREGWRKKINLPSAQKDVKTSRICIKINKIREKIER